MRICIVNPFFDDAPETFLEVTGRYRHVEALAAALVRRGHEVAVVQALHEEKMEKRDSVEFRYARAPLRSASRLSGGQVGLDLFFRGNLKGIVAATDAFQPDAVHMNGLTLLQPLAEISLWCAKRKRPLTVSYHGGAPRRAPWLHGIQRRMLERCRGVFFPSAIQAQAWIGAGLLCREQVIECMEVSSTFSPSDRASARARTGLKGSPVFVWNAGLHKRKDPITALKGFSLIRRNWPDARLYMIYLSDEMLPEVEATIEGDSLLRESVQLLGFIPHTAVQDFLNSADFLIQSSRSEVAGQSVLEAMACGVIPVVTEIPSFRAMANRGGSGILFPVGDYQLMASRVLQLSPTELEEFSRNVFSFFSRFLSYDAVAGIYERTLSYKSPTLCSILTH